MVAIKLSSALFDRLQSFSRTLATNPDAFDLADQHSTALDQFFDFALDQQGSVKTLTSQLVAISLPGLGATYTVSFAGSGIGPVSSLNALINAIDSGIASGTINAVTVKRGATTILSLTTTDTSYTLQSGVDRFTVTGALPNSFAEITDLAELLSSADVDTLATMTNSQRNAYFSDLSDFALRGLSVSTGGTEIFSFAVNPTQVRLTIAGFTIAVNGAFPTNLGTVLSTLYQAEMQFLRFGNFPDLSALSALDVASIVISQNGTELARITGPITDQTSTRITSMVLDGVAINPNTQLHSADFDGVAPGETLSGNAAPDLLFGSYGNDLLLGNSGDDILFGFGGNDRLDGGIGLDQLTGGNGADTLTGGTGGDVLNGGEGVDRVVYTGTTAAVVNLSVGGGQNTGHGTDRLISIEQVDGAQGHDSLSGNNLANRLAGNDGNDLLIGAGGADALLGGAGNDRLNGGSDNDVLSGGTGNDQFIFNSGGGADTVTDFRDGQDKIVIGTGANSFADVTVADRGASVRITFADVVVTLNNVDHTLITAADFIFV